MIKYVFKHHIIENFQRSFFSKNNKFQTPCLPEYRNREPYPHTPVWEVERGAPNQPYWSTGIQELFNQTLPVRLDCIVCPVGYQSWGNSSFFLLLSDCSQFIGHNKSVFNYS